LTRGFSAIGILLEWKDGRLEYGNMNGPIVHPYLPDLSQWLVGIGYKSQTSRRLKAGFVARIYCLKRILAGEVFGETFGR
jgi:hypothetical protein